MRRILACLTIAVLALPVAASAAKYGTAGCGLGSLVFGDEAGMIQIVAATLNATGIQTSGITSGTSNCTESAGASASLDQELFLKTNYASVMRDAATGDGEYLATLATLLGCEAESQPRFFSLSQRRYTELFQGASHTVVLDNFKKAISQDANLKASCGRV